VVHVAEGTGEVHSAPGGGGDYAIFLRDQAIEIEYGGTKYLIVPQSAILMLIRSNPMEELGE